MSTNRSEQHRKFPTITHMNIFKSHLLNCFTISILLSLSTTMNSCGDKVEEGELITTVQLTLNLPGDSGKIYTWQDLDGPGGNSPILPDTLVLSQVTPGGNPYGGNLEFFNKQGGKNENITLQIEKEKNNHLVCYEISSLTMQPQSGLSILPTDKDDQSLPVGLKTEWTTKMADKGNIWIRLKHQPSIKNGSCNVGETDVEVAFPYVIR